MKNLKIREPEELWVAAAWGSGLPELQVAGHHGPPQVSHPLLGSRGLGCSCPLRVSSRSMQACGIGHGLEHRETGVGGGRVTAAVALSDQQQEVKEAEKGLE